MFPSEQVFSPEIHFLFIAKPTNPREPELKYLKDIRLLLFFEILNLEQNYRTTELGFIHEHLTPRNSSVFQYGCKVTKDTKTSDLANIIGQ